MVRNYCIEMIIRLSVFNSLVFYVSPQNSIFWTGIFRPFSYLTQWYSGDDLSCQEYSTEEVDADLASDHRCVTISLGNLHDEITLAGDNCSNSLSYICSKHKGKHIIIIYKDTEDTRYFNCDKMKCLFQG